jgi:hypothetical protein
MRGSKIRLLYVPNEENDFRQVGFRRPLSNLSTSGLIGEVSVFSLQLRIRQGGNAEQHRQDLVQRVADFQPNLILMQHLGATGLRDRHFEAMQRQGKFKLIYHEADPYSRFLHPLPFAARAAGRHADVVFTVGNGWFANNFVRTGATDVRWAASAFEPDRYLFKTVDDMPVRDHDIVMIANRNKPRMRGLPNWKDRIRYVDYMENRFHDRFAIYGHGWSGPSARGPVDFSRQDEAIRSGWVSANWDHFASEPSYFSNRLPVSLSAGSIHATGMHPGYLNIFGEETREFLLLGDSHEALGDRIEGFLGETSVEDRLRIAAKAQAFAYRNYRQDNQLVQFLNFSAQRVRPESAMEIWDTSSNTLTGL